MSDDDKDDDKAEFEAGADKDGNWFLRASGKAAVILATGVATAIVAVATGVVRLITGGKDKDD